MIVVVTLGSCAPPADQRVLAARDEISAMRGVSLLGSSAVITTAAAGGQTLLPFANAAVVVETARHPAELLRALLAVERRLGRHRARHNAARTVDLDLVAAFAGQRAVRWSQRGLELPHPRLASRPFALRPAREALHRAGLAHLAARLPPG